MAGSGKVRVELTSVLPLSQLNRPCGGAGRLPRPRFGGEGTDARARQVGRRRTERVRGKSRPSRAPVLALLALGLAPCLPALAAEHPYILWTREDAAHLRRVIEKEPWAKEQYAAMGQQVYGKGRLETTFRNLFAYTVMGDATAGEAERGQLMRFAGESPEGKSRYYSPYEQALRYDVLHGMLTADERGRVEAAFRRFMDYHLGRDRFVYSREAFLPNMQWNRVMGTHLMAVAMGDERAIREMFASNGGWKWYMDEYVADGAFYFEEFGKQYSMITEMLLWCRGLERLGLDELGFGYTGRGGATMRSYMESILRLGYPRAPASAARPAFHRLTMGDAGDLHSIVAGYAADGSGGNVRWGAAKMNGGVPRMREPLWFELAHAKWPDAGFGWFLAQMRPPDADRYCPSLFFLSEPVDPAKARPPEAKSYVAPERGFAFLRAEESPAYWEGAAPAVAFQFATYYMHYTSDCFSILQLAANGRVLYRRRGVSRGYAGGCPWTDNVRSNTGVVADGLRARAVGGVPVRHGFDPLVKFAAALGRPLAPYPPVPSEDSTEDGHQKGCYRAMARSMGREIYPGVDLERALFLTREYLFDVYRLSSAEPREYHWQVQAAGRPVIEPEGAWRPTDELRGRLYSLDDPGMAQKLAAEPAYYDLKNVQVRDAGDRPFSVTFTQGDPAAAGGASGVRVHLLGVPGTRAYLGNIAGDDHTTLIVARNAPATTFLAVHEPFEAGRFAVSSVSPVQETAEAVAVAVAGPSVDDRLMYRRFGRHDEPATLSGGGESFTFADRAFVRVGADAVEASGDLRAATVAVRGRPRLVLNGRETPARIEGGRLVFGAP